MATRKNQLAQNIPARSTVNDIDTSMREKMESAFGFSFTPLAPKYEMELGAHKVVATGYRVIDIEPRTVELKDGSHFTVTQQHDIRMMDITTHETSSIKCDLYREAEIKFTRAINNRSGRDLGAKLYSCGLRIEQLSFRDLLRYMKKFPVEMLFEGREYTDEKTGEVKMGSPKLQIWNPEDFTNSKTPEYTEA